MLRDACPDAWGKLLIQREHGRTGHDLGITCLLPDEKEKGERTPNRVPAGGAGGTQAFDLFGDEPEINRVVVVAVEAVGGEPVSFRWMEDASRGTAAPRSPLGAFLSASLFGDSLRGATAPAGRYQMAARSWVMMPKG